nr:ABC transporter permease [Tepidimonas aquatica]
MIAPRPRGWDLWRAFSWPQWRLHPWRHAVAVLAIMLGVGLALAVHPINASALAEFSAAVRGVNGEPDVRLRGPLDRLDARWLDRALAHPQVRAAMPVIEAQGVAVTPDGHRVPVRLLGVDALVWPALQPDAGLRVREGGDRLDVLAPDAVFGNPAAQAALGTATDTVELQVGLQGHRWRVAGQVALPGGPLLVADVAALQDRLGWGDQVSRLAIRQVSLNIFDRSFAVTYWLQAVAIGMGLMGVSASFSAQVLVRRREFGLLRHLGLSRAQVLGLVAAEGALWTVLGAVAGLALGLAVSAVLVHVVNPQSFHWTMELAVPVGRLAALVLAVVAAGTLTAWASGRLAVRREAVLAVREEA